MSDSLSDRYADLLSGSYDCVDRIVLNAYFRMGHDPISANLILTGSSEGQPDVIGVAAESSE